MNQAINIDTTSLIGLAKLARIAFAGEDLTAIGLQLLERLALDPDDANALMDMSIVLHLKGNPDLGIAMQRQAIELQQIFRLAPPDSAQAGTHVLALVSPGDLAENNAVEFLLENSHVILDLLYIGPKMVLPATLPEFDVLMVAVSESDRNRPLLEYLEQAIIPQILQSQPRPLINKPQHIARLSRDGTCALLKTQAGIVVPITARTERETLLSIAQHKSAITEYLSDGDFPIIIRPVDSHKGIGLAKITAPEHILPYLAQHPEQDFYISRFIDYSSADGQFRKYRIVFIAGQAYVCHMAISDNWMVHYMSAGMLDDAQKRAEEAEFMLHFDQSFALKHQQAFLAITQKLDLEYVGIDCGVTQDGELLIFEVDSSMTVHAMDSSEIFPYKKIQMQKVFNAFIQLLDNTKLKLTKHETLND